MKKIIIIILVLLIALSTYMFLNKNPKEDISSKKENIFSEKATFAGGCFWSVEAAFEGLDGVLEVFSGYIGGNKDNPTYEEVSTGQTGHFEAVQISYNPSIISYEELLDFFWKKIDPTDEKGQFPDKGSQYKTAIFYHNEEQRELAEKTKENLKNYGIYEKPIVTEIIKAGQFYKAEEYHQDYYKKNSLTCSFSDKIWGNERFNNFKKPDEKELKQTLTPLQYKVTQEQGTEEAFNNKYWDNKEEGIYVDVVSGEPLFSSLNKYDSGTGWPSFNKALEISNIVKKTDNSLYQSRVEVRSKHADSHLGHLFDDGPAPSKLRYCMNSAALRFIPKEDLEKEGYAEYGKIF